MTKDELVVFLEQGRRTEEAVALYASHIRNTLYLSGLKKDVQQKLREVLDVIHKESNEHKILLNQLMSEAQNRGQDVY
jgi:hypothetical protein